MPGWHRSSYWKLNLNKHQTLHIYGKFCHRTQCYPEKNVILTWRLLNVRHEWIWQKCPGSCFANMKKYVHESCSFRLGMSCLMPWQHRNEVQLKLRIHVLLRHVLKQPYLLTNWSSERKCQHKFIMNGITEHIKCNIITQRKCITQNLNFVDISTLIYHREKAIFIILFNTDNTGEYSWASASRTIILHTFTIDGIKPVYFKFYHSAYRTTIFHTFTIVRIEPLYFILLP